MEFRPLNDAEKIAIYTLHLKGKTRYVHIAPWQVRYQTFKGGFTICTVCLPGRFTLNGVSRKSNKDKFKRIKGEMIAFVRAITESQEIKINDTAQEPNS